MKKSTSNSIYEYIFKKNTAGFIAIAFMIITGIPLVYPIMLPLPINPSVKAYYDAIQNLPEGSLIFFDIDGGGYNEIARAMIVDTLRHVIRKHLHFVQFSAYPIQWSVSQIMMAEVQPDLVANNYVYGVDYALIGYIPGVEIVMAGLWRDFQGTVKTDYKGTPSSQIPIFKTIIDHNSFDYAVFGVEGGEVIEEWSRQWPAGHPTRCIILSQQFWPTAQPFIPSVYQYYLASVVEEAQYQVLANIPGKAVRETDAWSVSNIWLGMEAVILNIWLFRNRLKSKKVKEVKA